MKTQHPTLYSSTNCPYAIRARFSLVYADISWQHEEVDLENKPQVFLEKSPKGTVPVLVLADGTVLDESYDIMRWAMSQSDPGNFYSRKQASFIDEWVRRNDEEFAPSLDTYRKVEGSKKARQESREQGLIWLHELASHISYGRLLGRPSLADIALFPFVWSFRNVDEDWFDSHAPESVQDWLDDYVGSPTFQEIMASKQAT